MRLVLFQPDIPQNAGAVMRLAACLDVGLDIIEPCGFVFDDRRVRRAGMDYIDHLDWARWTTWAAYIAAAPVGRLILLSAHGDSNCYETHFHPNDRLMVGRESAGVPPEIAASADIRIRIPLRPGLRSLNVATAAAMAAGEALRQTRWQAAPRR